MSEETRILLVNNLKPEDYMIITDNFRKLDKEIERLKSLNEKAIEYMNNYIEVEDAPINERIKTEFKEVIRLLTGGDE